MQISVTIAGIRAWRFALSDEIMGVGGLSIPGANFSTDTDPGQQDTMFKLHGPR